MLSTSSYAGLGDYVSSKIKGHIFQGAAEEAKEDLITGNANTRKDCSTLTGYGAPVAKRPFNKEELIEVCRAGYVLQHSSSTKGALWVAEYLRPDGIFGDEPRSNDFKPDPAITTQGRATLGDYKGSGYDRGHYAPAADFSRSAEQMADSFFLSNMGPQEPSVNRGVWAEIEKFTRKRASRTDKGLFVVTGPVFKLGNGEHLATKVASACPSNNVEPGCARTFEKTYATVGRKKVFVPDAYYKVILDPTTGSTYAFVVPNMPLPSEKHARIDPWLRSIKEVEDLTGLTFFPKIPQSSREKIISVYPRLGQDRR